MPRQADRKTAAKRFTIIAACFNPSLMDPLVDGACKALHKHGVKESEIQIIWVPGSFELPLAALWAAQQRRQTQAIIALGVLIQGQTTQYAHLAQAVMQGLTDVSLKTGIPVTCGVVVTEAYDQAKARAGGKMGNRGAEAAEAAWEMINLRKSIHA